MELARDANIDVVQANSGTSAGQKAEQRTYGQIENGRLVALFGFWTNTTDIPNGFAVPSSCINGLVGATQIYNSDNHGGNPNANDCGIVWPVTFAKPAEKSDKYYVTY